jgi:hypothetical protein
MAYLTGGAGHGIVEITLTFVECYVWHGVQANDEGLLRLKSTKEVLRVE